MNTDWQATYQTWLSKVNASEREILIAMSEEERRECFGRELSFGTAGMRGEVGLGTNRMNLYTVRRATAGLANYVLSLGEEGKQRGVAVSYDTRRFSKEFSLAVSEVLSAYGVKSYLFENVRPVPMCSFAVRYLNAAAGVMITASHNPKEYNGYKVYGSDGAQMAEAGTAKVVAGIKEADYFSVPYLPLQLSEVKDGAKLNEWTTVIGKDVDEAYYGEVLKLTLSPEVTKKRGKDIKLVYTPVHGAGYVPVTTVLSRLGISPAVVEGQAMPDTEFSTVRVPNPENADTLAMGMALGDKTGADVVLGTDPDCDRMGVAVRDNEGKFVLLTGNQIGLLLLDYILTRKKESGQLPKNGAVVKTIVTTTLADRLANDFGMTVFNVLTGFKYIGEKIKEWEQSGEYTYLFGYEESYGSLCGTHARDKDAVVACMLFSEMCLYYEEKGMTVYDRLQSIFGSYGYYIEQNQSVEYKGLDGMEKMANVMKALREKKVVFIGEEKVVSIADYKKGVKVYADGREEKLTLPATDAMYYELSDRQFVCVRPSGTEPKLKLYVLVFSDTKQKAAEKASNTMDAIKKILE